MDRLAADVAGVNSGLKFQTRLEESPQNAAGRCRNPILTGALDDPAKRKLGK